MALKLENEFVVAAPIDVTWRALLDLERVASCLPGAKIEPGDAEGIYRGSMRVKLGPMTMTYNGTAEIGTVDEAARTAVFTVQGKEARGQGSAAATIRNRLAETDGGTQVTVETDLSVTGRPAQFGRGIMQDVAGAMLGDFARCLSQMMAGDASAWGDAAAETPAAPGPDEATEPGEASSSDGAERQVVTDAAPLGADWQQPEALDLGRAVRGVVARRLPAAIAVVVALAALVAALVRRRRSRG